MVALSILIRRSKIFQGGMHSLQFKSSFHERPLQQAPFVVGQSNGLYGPNGPNDPNDPNGPSCPNDPNDPNDPQDPNDQQDLSHFGRVGNKSSRICGF